jgi:hypothetical protein
VRWRRDSCAWSNGSFRACLTLRGEYAGYDAIALGAEHIEQLVGTPVACA